MTQDEIIEMANKASKEWLKEFPSPEETANQVPKRFLEIFAKLVAAKAIAELESQEPVGFAGIEMWIGNKRIKKLMTQAELHSAIDPWAIVKFNSDSCIDALKEKNND